MACEILLSALGLGGVSILYSLFYSQVPGPRSQVPSPSPSRLTIILDNRAGQPIHAYLLDFQQVGVGNPFRDILSLIYSSTTKAFRSKFHDSLLKSYYSILKKYFQGYFFMSSCSYEMFYQHYLANRKFGFVWGLYIICVGKKMFSII